MTEASGHDEEMEDLVRTEVLVAGIEDRKLQGVDDAAHGVDDATGQKPAKGYGAQRTEDLRQAHEADPAHADIDDRRKPFWTGDPAGLDQDAYGSDRPDNDTHQRSDTVTERYHTKRCVGTGNKKENHDVIQLL